MPDDPDTITPPDPATVPPDTRTLRGVAIKTEATRLLFVQINREGGRDVGGHRVTAEMAGLAAAALETVCADLTPFLAAPPASDAAVPAGFVLVPVEPTEAMIRAGAEAMEGGPLWKEEAAVTWSAMIAAAHPSTQEG